MISWSDITCGEACWHAREEICRCSCGGKNHGVLRTANGVRPDRTCKIAGERYTFRAVGKYRDIIGHAAAINRAAGYRSIERPEFIIDSSPARTPEDIARAQEMMRTGDPRAWVSQYHYVWKETEDGAPARVKNPTASQWSWPELAGWTADRGKVEISILWERITPPERPTILMLDRRTGQPLDNQNPPEPGNTPA